MNRRHALGLLSGITLSSCQKREEASMWFGVVFGIPVSIKFSGIKPAEAQKLGDEAIKRVQEVERAVSLWDENSELRQLNASGRLVEPSAMMDRLMNQAWKLFDVTGGLFDPSIHSYLEWMKEEHKAGRVSDREEILRRRALVDFSKVKGRGTELLELSEGMALSFNGIAQGCATDLVARFLEENVESALVNFGEYRVVGERAWDVEVEGKTISLREALAVSSGSAERLSATSNVNHLINPKTGGSPPPKRVVAVEAPEAWLADGLATMVALIGEIPEGFDDLVVHWFD